MPLDIGASRWRYRRLPIAVCKAEEHIKLKAYRWNEERGPFVKVPIEE